MTFLYPVAALVILYALTFVHHTIARRLGWRLLLVTGIIGTFLHEAAHALVALLFGHRIVRFRPFCLDEDGTLGMVIHSYNPDSLLQVIGMPFIGVAPLAAGILAGYLTLACLIPGGLQAMRPLAASPGLVFSEPSACCQALWGSAVRLLSLIDFTSLRTWMAIWLLSCVSIHMVPSFTDLKNTIPCFIAIEAVCWLSGQAGISSLFSKGLSFLCPLGGHIQNFLQETAMALRQLLSISVALALFQLFLVILVAAAVMLFRKTWRLGGSIRA